MAITPLPTPPSTTDPTNFNARADAFMAALTTFVTEANSTEANVNTQASTATSAATAATASQVAAAASAAAAAGGTGYMGTSTATLSIGTGAKAVTGVVGKSFANGDQVTLIYRGDIKTRMRGVVSSANMGAGTMTVTVSAGAFAGSGSQSDWIVISSQFESLVAALAADVLAAIPSNVLALTPKALADAAAPVALTYGSTVTPDMSTGQRFTLNASASFTLGNPTNCKPGDVIEIFVTNTAGSIVLAVASAWKRQNGLFVLDPANGHTNKLLGIVETVDGSNNATAITYGGLRNPS